MAKKKRKRVDYDSPLTSIYSPEYQYLMKQNAPENANVAGLGDWFSNLFNRNKQQPDFHRDTVSMGLGTENSLQGVGNGGIDWNNQDFSFIGQSNQQQFDYNPNSELSKAQQYQLSLKDPENLAPKQNEQKKQNEQQPNTGSNINWGGIIGAAGTSAANAIQEGGSAADIAAGIMGIPVLAKMWKANTEWGDARIKEAQEKLTNPSIKFIQDANDTQGAGQGIKLNNQKNLDLIDTSGMLTTNNWKKFSSGRGSGTWWKNMATAQLQGAAAGSVGGPWGALGGATAGLLGSIGGLFGSKRRAKRAMNEYNRKITDIRTYANAENFRKIAEKDLSNKNMLSNGLNQQNLQDMSNFKAYGGNLYPDGGEFPPPLTGDFLDNIKYQTKHPNSFTPEGYTLDNGAKVRAGDFSDWIEDNASWLNYLPFVGTLSDIDKTLADPTIGNAAWALAGLATDLIPLGKIVKAFKGARAAEPIADLISNGVERNVSTLTRPTIEEYNIMKKTLGKDATSDLISNGVERNVSTLTGPTIEEYNIMKKTLGKDATSDIMSNIMEGNADGIRTATKNAIKKTKIRNAFLANVVTELANNFTDYLTTQEQNEKPNIFKEYYNMPLGSDNEIISNTGAKFHKVRTSKGNVWVDETGKISLPEEEMVDNLYNNRGYFNNTKALGGQFDISLSPNMMNLWNDKQNIDKQKVMNQQMNFGLGNSFNQKINTFQDGGDTNRKSWWNWLSMTQLPGANPTMASTTFPTVPSTVGDDLLNAVDIVLSFAPVTLGSKAGNAARLEELAKIESRLNHMGFDGAKAIKMLNEGEDVYTIAQVIGNTGRELPLPKEMIQKAVAEVPFGPEYVKDLFKIGAEFSEDMAKIGRLEGLAPSVFTFPITGGNKRYPLYNLHDSKEQYNYNYAVNPWANDFYRALGIGQTKKESIEDNNPTTTISNNQVSNGINKIGDVLRKLDYNATPVNNGNTISTPEDLHKAFYGDNGNNNIDTNNIINTPEDLHKAFYGDNNDIDDRDVTDKSNIINTPEDLHKAFHKDDNITAKKTPSKESTEKQKEYYNKKRQSYAEFNKDMGFLNKDDVKRFQEAYNREHEDKLKVDGLTGDKTIKAYQRWVNELNKDNKDKEALKIDGFYGKKSKSANNSDVANRMLNNEDFDINMLNNATVSTNEEPIEEPVQEPNVYEQESPEEVYDNKPQELTQEERYNMFQGYMNTPSFLRNPYYDKLTGKPIEQEAILQQLQQSNKFNNITNTNILQHSYGGNLNRFDYGGAMNGMDLPTDMQYYENGGTHEENPNGGIQVGVDPQGNPNLVEEGEFRYGDKVLSDRLNVNPDILSLFNAPKSKGNKTYAEVGKKLADKAKEGLNDPITKRTLDANMGRLFNSQEYQKKEAELDAQKDQQLAEYKNTLENPTQGNPMYGSMKYSGMGNANQGLNAGANEGMSNPMDSSDLSNVNRSGNAMMAAYGGMFANGGNLYPYGGYSRTPEDDAQLSFVRPLFNIGNYQNDWTKGNNYYNYDLTASPNTEIGLTPYEKRYTDEYVDAISKEDPRVRQQILQDEGLYDGKIDGIWGKKSKAAWDEFNRIRKIRDIYDTTQNAQPQQTTTTQTTTTQTNTPTQTTTPTNTSNSNSKSVYVKEKSSGSDVNSALNQAMNLGDKTGDVVTNNTANNGIGRINPVEKNGEYGRLEAQPYGLANPNVPWLSEAGKYANLAKYTMPFMTDQKNLTNWKYNINPAPANRLQAKGESSYANRTAEHLGDYVAPNLMDIERLNNAAMAQTTAQQRGTNNISGGNRGFANSQNAAIGFNGQMATGQNYATTNEYNANQKMTAANFNRDTNKFNVDADNEMHKDNLNSWLQGRNMDLNAHIAANQERLNERQYKDRVDRDAALNRQDNLNAMFNNQMNFIADEAKRRRELNEFNTLKNNRFYYDPRSGWNQKDDNGFNFEIADRLQSKGLYGFTGERDTAYKNLLKEKNGANFDKNDWKYIDKLIQMESDAKAHEQELVDAKKLEDRNNNLTEIQDIVSALNNTRDFHAWDSQRDYYNGLDYGDMSDEQVKRQLDFLRSIRNNYFNPQYWSNQSKTES